MLKILLVEDDKTIVANLTEYLNGAGYIVRSVSGQAACRYGGAGGGKGGSGAA